MWRISMAIVVLFVSLTALPSQAQEAILGQLYGNGVHSYFAGDYVKSFDQLTSAITAGSHDPRVYYFRGLAYLKLGRTPEAVQDFQKGADLESKDLGRSYNVARSLERVQGSARQQLEKYRVDARMAAFEEANKVRKARFEALKQEEERVLRTKDSAEAVPAPEGEPGAKAVDTDPFGNPQEPKESTIPEGDKATGKEVEKTDGEMKSDAAEMQPAPETDTIAAPKSVADKKPAAVKQSILKALIKGTESGIRKTIGGKSGGMGSAPPAGKAPAGGPSSNPFKEEPATEKIAPDSPAPEMPAAEKPAADAPAAEKPAAGKSEEDNPFGS
jgi:hypothetical protein